MSKKGAKGSKNDITNRGMKAKPRHLEGKQVFPVQFDGRAIGRGIYIAAKKGDGTLALDGTGLPMHFNRCPVEA